MRAPLRSERHPAAANCTATRAKDYGLVTSQHTSNAPWTACPLTACVLWGYRYCSLLAAAAMHFSLVPGDMLSSSIGRNENSSGRAPPPGNLRNSKGQCSSIIVEQCRAGSKWHGWQGHSTCTYRVFGLRSSSKNSCARASNGSSR